MSLIKNSILTTVAVISIIHYSYSQNLDSLMAKSIPEETNYATATFKGTRLINGHSVESPGKGVWQVMFSHRFGTLEDPLYSFFGLDQASVRFGLDYGISDRLVLGVGRSSGLGGSLPPPTWDFYVKYKLLRQSSGVVNMPVSVSVMGATAINAEKWADGLNRTASDRYSYTGQILIARKFSEGVSLQLMPTFLQRNLVESPDQKQSFFSMGIGGRLKVSKRAALTAEYYYTDPGSLGAGFYNPVSIGFDIDTGGHVFQIFLTNSTGLIEPQFLGHTQTDFFTGADAVRLGFNFTRVFGGKKRQD